MIAAVLALLQRLLQPMRERRCQTRHRRHMVGDGVLSGGERDQSIELAKVCRDLSNFSFS